MSTVLVLTSRWPFPPHGGDKIRILEICRQLAKKHRLILVASYEAKYCEVPAIANEIFSQIELIGIPRWRSHMNCLLALGSRTPLQVAYYRDARYRAVVEKLIRDADVVLAHLIRTAQYVPETYNGKKILESTDAISLVLRRARSPGRLGKFWSFLSRVEMKRVEVYEDWCMRTFDTVSLVSAIDCAYLAQRRAASGAKLVVATNGINLDREERVPDRRANSIIFIGNMATFPNIDACDYFIRECLARIVAKCPEVRFKIVGPIKRRTAERLQAGIENVEIIGEVADLQPVILDSFCGVAPMRRGGGIQNKILEYLAHALPCVTTEIGYEGLCATIGEEIIVANSSVAITEAVVMLKRDIVWREAVGRAGRKYVKQQHNWDKCLAPLALEVEPCGEGKASVATLRL